LHQDRRMGPRRGRLQRGRQPHRLLLGWYGRNNRIDTATTQWRSRFRDVDRHSHPDRIRHPARLQPRRLPVDHER
jgi:hypothetical protein